jgi:hypothetical protein
LILATSKSFGISQLLRSRGHHTAITSLGLGVLTCFVHHHFITCFVDIKILIWFSILTGFSFVVVIRCKWLIIRSYQIIILGRISKLVVLGLMMLRSSLLVSRFSMRSMTILLLILGLIIGWSFNKWQASLVMSPT